jgi:flagellin-like hook-associated protein FlgL
MPINDITLAGGMRTNLSQLQLVTALMARTTERLSTGKRVNSSVDDPAAFFAAQGHMNRASDLSARKDAMGEALQTISAADAGISAITSLIEQAKGLATQARSASVTTRATLATQFDDLMTQIDELAGDAGYKGTNLLGSGTLTVEFNEDGSSSLDVVGFDGSSTGLGIAAAAASWAADADIDAAVTDLNTALDTLRSQASTLGSNNGVITAREIFTSNMVTALTTGAENLTAADVNEESANLLALQTRQQLGISALSIASQSQQAVLRLF